jgi:arginyl-tRNA synthetase
MLAESAKEYKISSVVLYLTKIAQAFNEFYHSCPILKSEGDTKAFRLYIAVVTARVLKDGMDILGIPVLDEM